MHHCSKIVGECSYADKKLLDEFFKAHSVFKTAAVWRVQIAKNIIFVIIGVSGGLSK